MRHWSKFWRRMPGRGRKLSYNVGRIAASENFIAGPGRQDAALYGRRDARRYTGEDCCR